MENVDTFLEQTIKEAAGMYIDNGAIVLDYVYPYRIELSRCNTPGKILGWVNQLSGKNWMTTDRMNLFIQVAFSQIGIEVDFAI